MREPPTSANPDALAEVRTLAQALAEGTTLLRAAGLPSPARDARALLAHATNIPQGRLTLHLVERLLQQSRARYRSALEARLARQPVSQITGARLFWGRPFNVSPAVLDPRPETETLVGLALSRPFRRVLDLGTGSGCILVSLLADVPEATGVGIDLSQPALAIARGNAAALGVAERAEFRRGDWAEGLSERFDLVVTNPPYVAATEVQELSPEVQHWEPREALTSGGDGLDAYRRIVPALAGLLERRGRALLEIGPTQALAVMGLASAAGLVIEGVHTDLDGRDRVVALRATRAARAADPDAG